MTEESAAQQTTVAAFYSSADGAGRNCMVANIALILASQGQRVLLVDCDLASPSLHRYLAAFLPTAPFDAVAGSPARLLCRFDHPRGAIDFIGPVTDDVTDPGRFAVTRPALIGRGYDTVLVNTPASIEASAIARELADVLVLGYTLNQQYLDRAAQLARSLQDGGQATRLRVLPVPMRVDQNAGQATAQRRMVGHRQFAWLLSGMTEEERQHYWSEIEIPYEGEYSAEEGLPLLDPPSAHRDRLVSAHQRVARLLAAGIPETVLSAAVTSQTLLRYRDTRQAAVTRNSTVTILHAATDRHWAEWIAAALKPMGFTAVRRRIDHVQDGDPPAPSALIVVSAHLLSLPDLESRLRLVIGPAQPGGQAPVGASVDGRWLPGDLFPTLAKVRLSGRDAKQAHQELASYYQIADSSAPRLNQAYFPNARETMSVNLPAYTRDAIGRDDLIDQIRDHFTAGTAPSPLTLTGPAGMGKTLAALEYARRFAAAYDLIVFIRADSAEAIRNDLAALAAQVPPTRPAGDAGTAALAELQSTATPKRWLLICAGADDPSRLRGLIPEAGHGHVLLTARETVSAGSRPLAVPPLARADAEAMVSRLVEGISPEHATWVANAMQGIPLALQLACAWVRITTGQVSERGALLATVTDDTVRQLKLRLAEPTEGAATASPDPVSPVVDLHLAGLRLSRLGETAKRLLETCAFLGSSGLSWRLLRSREMCAQLAAENPEMSDPVLLSSALHEIASRGLLLLEDATLLPGDMTRAPLRVHPRVLEVVRERLAPHRQVELKQQVSRMLAASASVSIDDDVIGSGPVYAELLEHVGPSGAAVQTDDTVRQWLVNEIRFLWQSDSRSSWATAVELGERLSEYWRSALPGDLQDRLDDPLVLRLHTQLANVYRSRGQFTRARELDEDALARERRVLGLWHPRTLMTARSYGADLRLVGDFEGALLEDSATWQAAMRTMGRNHLLTITASGNLALSELLAGEPEQALQRRQEHDLPWCERFEEERPWEIAWILGHIGTLQRELGRYQEALNSLRQARVGFLRGTAGDIPTPTSLEVLRVDGDIAIAERLLGRPDPRANHTILEKCIRLFGAAHQLVPATILSQAGDLHATGDPTAAVRRAGEALTGHIDILGPEHPFTRVNQVDLSTYALAAGEFSLAGEMSQSALTALELSLGRRHLWTLAAAVAQANVLAVTDQLDAAAPLEKRALDEYRERFGADHPFTQAALANARHSRRLRNESRPAADPAAEAAQRHAIELSIPPL